MYNNIKSNGFEQKLPDEGSKVRPPKTDKHDHQRQHEHSELFKPRGLNQRYVQKLGAGDYSTQLANKLISEKNAEKVNQTKAQPNEIKGQPHIVDEQLLNELANLELELAQLNSENDAIKEELDNVEKKVKNADKEVTRRSNAYQKLKNANEELQVENAYLKQYEHVHLKKWNDSAGASNKDEIQKLQTENKNLSSEYNRLQNDNYLLTQKCDNSRINLDKIKTKIEEKEQIIVTLELEINRYQEELASLGQQAVDLTAKNQQMRLQNHTPAANEEVTQLLNQIEAQKNTNSKLRNECLEIKTKCDDAVNLALKEELVALKSAIKEVELQLEKYRNIIDDLKHKNQSRWEEKLKLQKKQTSVSQTPTFKISNEEKDPVNFQDGWSFVGSQANLNGDQYVPDSGSLIKSLTGYKPSHVVNFGTFFCNTPKGPAFYTTVGGRTSPTSKLLDIADLTKFIDQANQFIQDRIPFIMHSSTVLAKLKEGYAAIEKVSNKDIESKPENLTQIIGKLRTTAKIENAELVALDQARPDKVKVFPGLVALQFDLYNGNIIMPDGSINALIIREGQQEPNGHEQSGKYFYIVKEVKILTKV